MARHLDLNSCKASHASTGMEKLSPGRKYYNKGGKINSILQETDPVVCLQIDEEAEKANMQVFGQVKPYLRYNGWQIS